MSAPTSTRNRHRKLRLVRLQKKNKNSCGRELFVERWTTKKTAAPVERPRYVKLAKLRLRFWRSRCRCGSRFRRSYRRLGGCSSWSARRTRARSGRAASWLRRCRNTRLGVVCSHDCRCNVHRLCRPQNRILLSADIQHQRERIFLGVLVENGQHLLPDAVHDLLLLLLRITLGVFEDTVQLLLFRIDLLRQVVAGFLVQLLALGAVLGFKIVDFFAQAIDLGLLGF